MLVFPHGEIELTVSGIPQNSRRDREIGMERPITRCDFINGVAVTIAPAGLGPKAFAAAPEAQNRSRYDPPVLTGMRGSHPGSFAYAHVLRDGVDVLKIGPIANSRESWRAVQEQLNIT